MGVTRANYDYQPVVADRDEKLRERMRELAHQRRRFGCPRIHLLLQREGLVVNHKRTERIYREEGLSLRKRKRKKTAAMTRVILPAPKRPNQRWSVDFVTDSLASGHRRRALVIVDDYSRECPAIEVGTSIGGHRVVPVLERPAESRGLPEIITLDNGPEFTGKALDEWAYSRGVKLKSIRPAKPIENAYAESFIGRLRAECLNENWFLSLRDAKDVVERWRVYYDDDRPHSALRGLSPWQYVENRGKTLIGVGL